MMVYLSRAQRHTATVCLMLVLVLSPHKSGIRVSHAQATQSADELAASLSNLFKATNTTGMTTAYPSVAGSLPLQQQASAATITQDAATATDTTPPVALGATGGDDSGAPVFDPTLIGTGANLMSLSTAITNLEANTGYSDLLRFRGYLVTIGNLELDTFAKAIAPPITIYATILAIIANIFNTVAGAVGSAAAGVGLGAAIAAAQLAAMTAAADVDPAAVTVDGFDPADPFGTNQYKLSLKAMQSDWVKYVVPYNFGQQGAENLKNAEKIIETAIKIGKSMQRVNENSFLGSNNKGNQDKQR